MGGLTSIGISGLNAAQIGLSTTGHNITNASTPGFSRQQILQGTQNPQFTGSGFVGQGTHVATVTRAYSQYLVAQLQNAETRSNELTAYGTQIKQLDDLLADPLAGLSPALQDFYNGLQSVANDPTSVPARQSAISSAQSLAGRFNALDDRINEIRAGINSQIASSVTSINGSAGAIAELNQRIALAQAAGNQPANDLFDRRDELIRDLNGQLRVTTLQQDDGAINVFVGNGQPLVVGNSAFNLAATPSPDDASRTEVSYLAPGGASLRLREDTLTGGTLGGLLSFRSQTLDMAQNALGRVAVGLTDAINGQQALGQDLTGALGGNFFAPPAAQALPGAANNATAAATLSVTLTNPAELTTSDYQLSFDGSNYTLLRLADNQAWSAPSLANLPPAGSPQGFTLADSATPPATGMQAGDIFTIYPTRNGAHNITVTLTDPRAVAAAQPMRTSTSTGNAGTAAIDAGSVTSTAGLPLAASPGGDITLTYDTLNKVFNVAGGPGGTLAYDPATDAGGKTFVFATPGGFTFRINGTPINGDRFTIGANTQGVGDNRNVLRMQQTQTANLLVGNTASLQGAYAQMVSDVGNKAREIDATSTAQQTLVTQVQSQRDSFSGVNLDEEAANLLRYQQAYQASGKMIEVASKLFDTLLALGH
ncbi:MAG: flagellar hook-associated protein FlgK [Rhodocyclaceae bacterium]|nr:flagellar hook-associated protein FlgK [Rhodocyclaceae bacterium]MBX3670685.1 flagellar hook-associated protein FlgK [Rhodocyclaceae bacterium]